MINLNCNSHYNCPQNLGFSLLLTIIWRALLRYLALSLVNSIFVAKRSTWLTIPSELTINMLSIHYCIVQTISLTYEVYLHSYPPVFFLIPLHTAITFGYFFLHSSIFQTLITFPFKSCSIFFGLEGISVKLGNFFSLK